MRANKFFLIGIFLLLLANFVSASRLPTIGGDEDDWGNVLNDFLSKIAGANATELNETMVNGTNIYSSSINTTHILDGTISAEDLADDSINSSKIDLTEVTLSDFTNDVNYLDKDQGGIIDGSLIVSGNFTLIGNYLNATVTNQYLNGSFLPDITNLFDIGSSARKWANLYVTNIYTSRVYSDDWSNVTIQESQISDLQSYLTSESDPLYSAWDKDYGDLINTPTIPTIWDSTFNDTGDARWGGATDTQKSADGIYLYNDTSTIYFNETKLNDTIENIADNYNETNLINSVNSSLSTRIDGIAEGNSSFNQSLTDTLYAGIEWDYNQTTPAISWVQNKNYLTSVADNSTTIAYQNISNIPTCGANEHLDFDGTILSCTADSSSADGTGSWTNTSTTTSTDLNVNLTTGDLTVSNGKVGIGTTSPGAKLDVNGSAVINGSLNMENNNITNLNLLNFTTLKQTANGIEWIKPEHILDVDKADIETDLNTFVDIAGDTMTGDLTAPWFKGLFNWTTTDSWSSFDGAIFDFNESKITSTYVPYTGANQNVDLGSYNLTSNYGNFTGNLNVESNMTVEDTLKVTNSSTIWNMYVNVNGTLVWEKE